MNRNDQQFIAQKIRTQYMEQQPSALDDLRALDAQVKKPANVFAYVFGSVSAIIMGAGMSLVMTDIGAVLGLADAMIPGIVIGIVGMILAIVNYPIYKRILASRKEKYAADILALSEKIMNQ
ncbi:MAG: dihydropteridine reductase [Ruminococcaceae bacterium]|nr:dihydropteridine reductase [Oscillospiraceae bacterium]